MSKTQLISVLATCVVITAPAGHAHHSYAMFNGDRIRSVSGKVAKLEWTHPHTFLWVYVPNAAAPGGYDLYAFENGGPNELAQRGWRKDIFDTGELITVEYWPLKDGRNGGHLRNVIQASGVEMRGSGGPRGANGDLETDAAAAARQKQ